MGQHSPHQNRPTDPLRNGVRYQVSFGETHLVLMTGASEMPVLGRGQNQGSNSNFDVRLVRFLKILEFLETRVLNVNNTFQICRKHLKVYCHKRSYFKFTMRVLVPIFLNCVQDCSKTQLNKAFGIKYICTFYKISQTIIVYQFGKKFRRVGKAGNNSHYYKPCELVKIYLVDRKHDGGL